MIFSHQSTYYRALLYKLEVLGYLISILDKETKELQMNDTNVAPNNNLSPKRATTSPFSELSDLMAPEIIPIELKFANDTKNTDVTPFACSDISLSYLRLHCNEFIR